MKIMKTLSIGGNTYEIFDAKARSDIEALKKSGVGSGSGGSSGGVISWNDLTDKPFELAEVTYEYNADTTYDEVIVIDEEQSFELVKISDNVVEPDIFIGGYLSMEATVEGESFNESFELTEDMILIGDGMYAMGDYIIVVTAESIQDPGVGMEGLVYPRGVWTVNYAKAFPGIIRVKATSRSVPLDESLIPDTIARKTDITWENLPDKPFYNTYEEVIPEQEYSTAVEEVTYRVLPDADFEKIEEGKTYVVNCQYSGEITTCVAQKYEDQFISGIILGNPWWAGGNGSSNNGLNFAVVYRENDDGTIFKKVYVAAAVDAMTFGVKLVVPVCLDDSFIPDTIARKTDVIQTPVSATIGQIIVVKAVDENGRPTEWECVDLPTGGSGSGSSSTSGLPPVTEADNGKVLTVVNGVWTAVAMPDAEQEEF